MSQDGAQGRYTGRSVGGGRYQLRDLLGEGGMASVHLAYDSVLDRQVAIKTLHTELGREASFRERFRREAQAVAKLTHTNIVSVFDTGEDDLDGSTMPYIVMEYVEGQPLRSVLDADVRQFGAMPTEKALKITADVLAALEVSHEMGLVHRDIKPGNVMMTKRGVVKVMDFGIARAMQSGVTSMTQTGMVVGTPQYLSPEQALGRGVDARSDLYSVGIMLFELLTGRLPFDADSPLAIAYAHVQEEPVAPSSINRSIPPAVDALVARALKKNPNERFPSAESMRDECARVAGTAQSGASPVIVAGGPPARSGAGVSSAVFPPVDAQTPGPGPQAVQTPYQPAPGPYASYGPATPPPGAPGYPTPVQPFQAGGPNGPGTPPPYSINPSPAAAPQGGSGGGKSNKPVIIGSGVVAVLAVIGVIAAIALNGNSGKGEEADGKNSPPPVTGAPAGGTAGGTTTGGSTGGTGGTTGGTQSKHREGDRSKAIDKEKCTKAYEYYNDKSKKSAPNFSYFYVDSVKACLQAAGWKYRIDQQNENTWGKGTVLSQTPKEGDAFDPKSPSDMFVLTVSTGDPAS
ncbi:protein kinase domain-containing protein [Streptomyces albireticuli]|uniref:non-specific serine/threonine protein kinase n=1 Tax=Streptomyces albireticuli TaxID=1940 RepID=A0A2A2DGQ5_9ACTN|nr:protein kinase [Streptomyces albireticuli]MCD9143840.1 protein kinase [Streptomyces albireticuli]MCD9161729.1 protein kinase [Streptomyces albireticuli]MCD9191957.1 protein kinase [Streptomyces albireticuli]PAU50715.1 serine/threonine protein kinase [Streptomyces albireticuli]